MSEKNKGDASDKRTESGVHAVDRALAIVRCFLGSDGPLGLSEIAQRTGYYKSTVLRLTESLEKSGFLVRHPDKRFSLGSELMRLGLHYMRTLRLEEHVRPALRHLVKTTGESAAFYRRDGDRRICLFREECAHPIREYVLEGETRPVHAGSIGRVFSLYDTSQPSWDKGIELPIAELNRRPTGDLASVAVPVFATTELAGIMSISGPTARFTPDKLAMMRPELLTAAETLSRKLGGETLWRRAMTVG